MTANYTAAVSPQVFQALPKESMNYAPTFLSQNPVPRANRQLTPRFRNASATPLFVGLQTPSPCGRSSRGAAKVAPPNRLNLCNIMLNWKGNSLQSGKNYCKSIVSNQTTTSLIWGSEAHKLLKSALRNPAFAEGKPLHTRPL